MRVSRSPFLAAILFAVPSYAQNYTTNITLNHLLTTGGPVSSAVVCVQPADVYGNPISVAAPTWGLIAGSAPVNCGSVVSGAISGGINVPDAAHTYASASIYYNFYIQQREFPGGPIVQKTLFKAVPNVTGPTFSLDQYTPAVALPYPVSNIVGTGSSVPSSCTSPSLFLPNNQALVYTCNSGVYVAMGASPPSQIFGWVGGTSYPLGTAVLYNGLVYYSSIGGNTTTPAAGSSTWTAAPFDTVGSAANVQSNLNTEASTRASADSTLQTSINTEAANRASAVTAAIATAEAASDSSGAAATVQSNLNTEASTRASADSTLQTNINTEAANRASAVTAAIATAEAASDANGSAATVQSNLNTEASTRASADSTLQTSINTEASARATAVSGAISSSESYALSQIISGGFTNATTAPISGSPNTYIGRYWQDSWNLTPTTGSCCGGYIAQYLAPLLNGPGSDNGVSGTSAGGWSQGKALVIDMEDYARGNHSMFSGTLNSKGIGDRQAINIALKCFGGATAGSDEGCDSIYSNLIQDSYTAGTVTAGAGTGSSLITATITADGLTNYGGGSGGGVFNDGTLLLDLTQGGATATLTSAMTYDATANGMYYTISTTPSASSTAYGNIVQNTCTNNGQGRFQQPVNTTCNIALLSGSGHFTTSSLLYLAGPFSEPGATPVAVTQLSSSLDQVTFSTRYAWDSTYGSTNPALVTQGGSLAGLAFTATGTAQPVTATSWSIASNLVTFTASTGFQVGQAVNVVCPTSTFLNGLFWTVETVSPLVLGANGFSHAAASATENCTLQHDWPIAWPILGYFNGRMYFANCTLSTCNNNNQFTQGGTVLPSGASITTYPMAEIIGTNKPTSEAAAGASAQAMLAPNTIPVTVGDNVIASPTSQYLANALRVLVSRNSPNTGPYPGDSIYQCMDAGQLPFDQCLTASNSGNYYNAAQYEFWSGGAYKIHDYLNFRPTQGLIEINGQRTALQTSDPCYFWIWDHATGNANVAGTLNFCPLASGNLAAGALAWNNMFSAGALQDTGVLSAKAIATDSNGNLSAATIAGLGAGLLSAPTSGTTSGDLWSISAGGAVDSNQKACGSGGSGTQVCDAAGNWISLGSGSVTAVSVATLNGFQGSSSGGATPTLTLNVDSTHFLPINNGSSTQFLNGTGGYTAIPLGSAVSGTLGAGNGGTGQTTLAASYQSLYETVVTAAGGFAFGGTSGTPTQLSPNTTSTPECAVETSSVQAWTQCQTVITTTATATVSVSGPNAVYINNDGSNAVTYNLPAPSISSTGVPSTIVISNNASATGVLTVQASTGTYIEGGPNITSSAGYLQSGGVSGDSVQLVAIDSNHWIYVPLWGGWSVH